MDRMNAIYHNGRTAFCFPFLYFSWSGLLSFKWLSHCIAFHLKNEYFALVRNRNVICNSNYNLFHLFIEIFIVGLLWLRVRLRLRLRLFDLNNNRFCSFSYIIYVWFFSDRNVFIKYLIQPALMLSFVFIFIIGFMHATFVWRNHLPINGCQC